MKPNLRVSAKNSQSAITTLCVSLQIGYSFVARHDVQLSINQARGMPQVRNAV